MSAKNLFVPLLAPILRDRKWIFAISGAAVLQLGLAFAKLPGWPCPMLRLCGIPCPGCGLTRATILLFEGEWQRSITFHAFAPVFLVALALIVGTAMLPAIKAQRVSNFIEGVELSTGITYILLLGLIIYWLARLLIMQSAFVSLIRG